jgi:NADH-quinone oxidoreductase subunit G
MAKITIDGITYEVADGRTILQAADDLGLLMNGVDIPHYCWHPKLSIDGSCRLCQVEIEGIPKLQIACNTPVRDGMVIRTRTDRVATTRRGVMELLLLNHPLDCPICDQAGECKLQDYAYDYGLKHARTDDPRRPAKKSYELGPTIVFDQERCILCRRCVRFCREIPKTGELGVFQRGDESLLELFPGKALDNAYSMNVADVCPVGALTTQDFRFKIRVWFLDDVASVCNHCSGGCNIYASRAHNKVYRYVPRRNDAVNDTWICDRGRMSYKTLRENRLESARVGGSEVLFSQAIAAASDLLRASIALHERIVAVATPFMPNEDLFALRELCGALGIDPPTFVVPRGAKDEILMKEEKAPNASGARALGFRESADPIGPADLAIVIGHTTALEALEGVRKVVLIDTHLSPLVERADVVLPCRTFAEREGSFTNFAGRVQRFDRILEPAFEAWSEAETLQQIASAAGIAALAERRSLREWSKALCSAVPAFEGRGLDALGYDGTPLHGAEPGAAR